MTPLFRNSRPVFSLRTLTQFLILCLLLSTTALYLKYRLSDRDSEDASPDSTEEAALFYEERLLGTLYDCIRHTRNECGAKISQLLEHTQRIRPDNPNWPTVQYLVAEWRLSQNNTHQAREMFRHLAEWGVSDPYMDTWGGSSLSAIALWRWLQLIQADGITDKEAAFEHALRIASELQQTRFFRGLVRPSEFHSLPKLYESVSRHLVYLAYELNHNKTTSLFLDYLNTYTGNNFDELNNELINSPTIRDNIDHDRYVLAQADRLLTLRTTDQEKQDLMSTLTKLWENKELPTDIRVHAGYLLAYHIRLNDRRRTRLIVSEIIDLAPTSGFAERGLYLRARTQVITDEQLKDLNKLMENFPNGPLADDARYLSATILLRDRGINEAMPDFRVLQDYPRRHDRQDSSYLVPALALIRHATEDPQRYDEADLLLEIYAKRYPDGIYRLNSLFWRARIAEINGKDDSAREIFRAIIDEAPYSYFGIRSRMHLEFGREAMSMDLPSLDSQTYLKIKRRFQESKDTTIVTPQLANSVYHSRLDVATSTGLYSTALRHFSTIEPHFMTRLDRIPIHDLEENHYIPTIALVLSFRQDSAAALDSNDSAKNVLHVFNLIGNEARDWPWMTRRAFALELADPLSGRKQLNERLQDDSRYLVTLYPDPSELLKGKFGNHLIEAAWKIGDRNVSMMSVMYSIIRQESAFYPAALSKQGAMGLFQFMGSLFKSLDQGKHWNWRLLEQSRVESAYKYLMDPERNISLWADWVQASRLGFHSRNGAPKEGFLVGLVRHQAGETKAKPWITQWEQQCCPFDLEYSIDTIPLAETRGFVRRVLRDTFIMEASGYWPEG